MRIAKERLERIVIMDYKKGDRTLKRYRIQETGYRINDTEYRKIILNI